LPLFNNYYYLINYSKTQYIIDYTSIHKTLVFAQTLGVSAFYRDLFIPAKNDYFIYYFLLGVK